MEVQLETKCTRSAQNRNAAEALTFPREVQKQLHIWTIVRCIWKIGGVSSSCTSGRKAPGAGRWEPAQATPRNQLSNLEGLGHGDFLHSSPTLSVARESIAVTSRSDSGIATAGAATQPNLPLQKLRLTLRCSNRHLVVGRSAKDTAGTLLLEGPARSIGSSTGCGAQEERWSLEGLPPL